ncbi:hypothetical protein SAY87_008738 [Trapa incisa]|uniref:Elongation factor Ts, mitochondrial n=1 Tax=Trapa incisa TaxID=236973 RepID=A0AAN7PWB6_9MYRT|nr:hypothetical protein SAY87_008738 [Trapa incisa]
MMSVIASTSVSLINGTTFAVVRCNNCSTCQSTFKIRVRQRYNHLLLGSLGLFPQNQFVRTLRCKSRNHHIVLATETGVAVEEQSSSVEDGDSLQSTEAPTELEEGPAPAQQARKARIPRKSEMPSVKNEELIPGVTFTGKVRSIQPFGAFVDFGAFTDGLVHVSQLSNSFVKDISSFVSIGQEVKVRLLEANTETGRISLSMREGDSLGTKPQKQPGSSSSGDSKPRTSRKNSGAGQKRVEARKTSKFSKGQDLTGTVKNLTRSGAFVSLPEGEEGFLPFSEEADDGLGSMMGSSSLEIGLEVNVRVLRIARGQVTLTMKKGEDNGKLDPELTQGVIYEAKNPFVLAFQKNKEIAMFLSEKENLDKSETEIGLKEEDKDIPEVVEAKVSESLDTSVQTELKEQEVISEGLFAENNEPSASFISEATSAADVLQADESVISEQSGEVSEPTGSLVLEEVSAVEEQKTDESVKNDHTADVSEPTENLFSAEAAPTVEPKADESIMTPQLSESYADLVSEEVTTRDELKINEPLKSEAEDSLAKDTEQVEETVAEIAEEVKVEDQVEASAKENGAVLDSEVQADVSSSQTTESKVIEESKENNVEQSVTADEQAEEDTSDVPAPEENGNITGSNGQGSGDLLLESSTKASISPALVKQLREETGAGMMDCKKALAETGGDIVKAQEFLRKKGLASAEKKAARVTAEGRIGSYIHDSRIGVLVEVNCETDFVSRGEIFKELVDDLAMQVAACPQVQYLATEEVPAEYVSKEKEIEMQKDDLLSKPENIREKIVEGRIRKRLEELALLEQTYIKNDKVVVKDWVKQTIATVGENIKVKRFVRFNLGEGLEKKSQDFAAEVAAQTATKPLPSPAATEEQKPAAEEPKAAAPKAPTVAVSVALVKQLREETGAGMMDCKKALAETGGDLEKAQEYLRKKGLSTADKKSSRLAAEGRIGSYIHDSRIGVLIEVNCETDFVGRSEKFKELVDDLAMQVVACPQVQFVSVEDIGEDVIRKEKELEMQREDLQSKPENIRERIVEGRVSKRLGELALLEQAFIKDDSILVKDLVKQTVAALGENIKVRRFVRFTLGESSQVEGAASD